MADGEEKGTAADAGAPPPETVGQALKKARAAQDLSLEQLAAELRIEARQLVALEADQFDRIGVPVFVKGYLRQYGTRLGLDPRDLLALYYKQGELESVDIKPSRTIKMRDQQQVTVWVVAVVVLLLIAAGLVLWWLDGAAGFDFKLPGLTAPVESESQAAPDAARGDAAPASGTAAALAGSPRTTDAAPPPAEPIVAAPAAGDAPAEEPPAAETPAPADDAEEPAAAPLAPLSANAVDLDVTFVEESWAEISDARGQRLFFGLAEPGRRAQMRGDPPFSVLLGNAQGVQMTVAGAPYEIPRSGPGNLARFTVEVSAR